MAYEYSLHVCKSVRDSNRLIIGDLVSLWQN